mgnify:CR=1 FL=1
MGIWDHLDRAIDAFGEDLTEKVLSVLEDIGNDLEQKEIDPYVFDLLINVHGKHPTRLLDYVKRMKVGLEFVENKDQYDCIVSFVEQQGWHHSTKHLWESLPRWASVPFLRECDKEGIIQYAIGVYERVFGEVTPANYLRAVIFGNAFLYFKQFENQEEAEQTLDFLIEEANKFSQEDVSSFRESISSLFRHGWRLIGKVGKKWQGYFHTIASAIRVPSSEPCDSSVRMLICCAERDWARRRIEKGPLDRLFDYLG